MGLIKDAFSDLFKKEEKMKEIPKPPQAMPEVKKVDEPPIMTEQDILDRAEEIKKRQTEPKIRLVVCPECGSVKGVKGD